MPERVYAHFIGVGGAGMSGIAKVLHDRGRSVSGSDLKDSRYVQVLREAGIPVYVGHAAENLGDPEVVVVSSAIPEHNPELIAARERGIPVWPRARMLAEASDGRRTVAIAGTHGKTTTSSMVATMLAGMGLDPTFLIGGELNDMGANARCGEGDLYVVEADESDGSFLHLSPHVAVVTNIEADHLDHYADLAEVVESFESFLSRVDPDGCAVVCADDPRAVAAARRACRCRVVTYGRSAEADVRCEALEVDGRGHRFTLVAEGADPVEARLGVPGEHNVVNAAGAVATAVALGLDPGVAAAAVGAFTGVRRRFERIGEAAGVTVVDDYAHHPTEVLATLSAARAVGFGRVWVVFQPHRYSRTAALGAAFGSAFGDADRLVLMDVYGAGEAPIPGVSGKTVLDAVLHREPRARVAYFPHRAELGPYVTSRLRPGDLVLTMGAGDVTTLGPELLRALDESGTGSGASCR